MSGTKRDGCDLNLPVGTARKVGANRCPDDAAAGGAQPFFRTSTKVAAFAAAFAAFLVFQAGAMSVMYAASRRAVKRALSRELSSAAGSAAFALSIPVERGASGPELDDMIWRVRESNRLDAAIMMDPQGLILASSFGAPRGAPASVFAASPREVARTLAEGQPVSESFRLLGERYLRVYRPVKREGKVWAVLCLDAHDPTPHGLAALNWPFGVGLAVSTAAALAVAAAVVAMMRFFDRSKREMLRVERLVTAGALSASIAHEVKNPMGIILSAAQLLERSDSLGGDERELVSTITEEVRRAEAQLDAFLDVARDFPLKLVDNDLVPFINGTLELLAARARSAGIALERELPDGPVTARFDRRKLRQALVNMLLNAFEALDQGPVGSTTLSGRRGTGKVHVRLVLETDGAPSAVIAISDDGPGIPGERLAHIWEPFFSTKDSGTGLGLPQARQIVERHGGSMDLTTRPGEGTTVLVRLPLMLGGG